MSDFIVQYRISIASDMSQAQAQGIAEDIISAAKILGIPLISLAVEQMTPDEHFEEIRDAQKSGAPVYDVSGPDDFFLPN